MQERRRGVSPTAAEYVDICNSFESTSTAAYNHFFSPSTLICFSSTATRDGSAVGGSLWLRTLMHPIPDRAVRTVDTQ